MSLRYGADFRRSRLVGIWDELSLGTNYGPTPQSVVRFLKLCSADTHFRFSLEYSLARNLANCSLPAGSRSTSSREKAQRFTLRVESSLVLLSRSQNDVSSLIHGFDGSAGVNIGSYSLYCSQDWIKLKQVSTPCLKRYKTPAMHRDTFRLQLANNRRKLIENLPPPWKKAIYFEYNVKSSDKTCWDKWQLFVSTRIFNKKWRFGRIWKKTQHKLWFSFPIHK